MLNIGPPVFQLLLHMKNPKIPSMHFNTRFIVTSKNWFGGGMDATQSVEDKIERNLFHNKIKLMHVIDII